jgi:hypothetical protein
MIVGSLIVKGKLVLSCRIASPLPLSLRGEGVWSLGLSYRKNAIYPEALPSPQRERGWG